MNQIKQPSKPNKQHEITNFDLKQKSVSNEALQRSN